MGLLPRGGVFRDAIDGSWATVLQEEALTEHEGKPIPINRSRQDKEQSDDRKTAVQQHPRTEPVSVRPPKESADAVEAEVDPLEKVRRIVRENRDHLKSSVFIDEASGEIAAGHSLKRAIALEALTLLAVGEKEAWENRDRWMRSVADLENYKKRALHEKSRLITYQYEDLLKALLPVLDNLERALDHSQQGKVPEAFIEGVQMIAQMLKGVLEKYSVTPVKALGERFDPAVHEALSRMPVAGAEPNVVVEELEKGYMYKDRLLRPAKVVISG